MNWIVVGLLLAAAAALAIVDGRAQKRLRRAFGQMMARDRPKRGTYLREAKNGPPRVPRPKAKPAPPGPPPRFVIPLHDAAEGELCACTLAPFPDRVTLRDPDGPEHVCRHVGGGVYEREEQEEEIS